jgi:hypothetical protein
VSGALTRKSLLRATTRRLFADECVRLAYNAEVGRDEDNMPEEGYTEGAAIPCLFASATSREVIEGAEALAIDGKLWLPHDTIYDNRDRFRLTKRYGEAMPTPLTFAVVGAPRPGPEALVLKVALVTDGSDG